LEISDTKLNKLGWIAVSAGPGSFTGLRIGLSAAKGLGFGAGIPLLMVPTYQAIALQTSELYDEGSNFIIANKVNMDEVYFAEFSISKNSFIFVEDLKIINKNELISRTSGKRTISNITGFENNFSWISVPAPFYIAKWSVLYGAEKATNNFDNIEPMYYKEFIPIKR
jgi:tRNA threonylcarbamoyl adenosine modification protein YeaZ